MKTTKTILIVALLLAVVVAGTLGIEGLFQKALDVRVSPEIAYRGIPIGEMQLLYTGYGEEAPTYPVVQVATAR